MPPQKRIPPKSKYEWLTTITGHEVGDYVLDQYIGAGKIGYVYQAHLKAIPDITFAVKLVPIIKTGWHNELRKVAKLSTVPNVVHFHHVGTAQLTGEGQVAAVQYTVWDYIPPGRSLKDFLASATSIPTSFIIAIVNTILRVLHACERMGIPRHGDLHPGNILIGEQDDAQLDTALMPVDPIYVSDFGYGTSSGIPVPKDDYNGLAEITNALLAKVDWSTANSNDRQLLMRTRDVLTKLLRESTQSERTSPRELLYALSGIRVQVGRNRAGDLSHRPGGADIAGTNFSGISVGQ